MYIICAEKNGSGGYPPLQEWRSAECPNGYYFYPSEFFATFYHSDKRCAGFVNYTIDQDSKTVNSVTWDEDAYQAYIATLPPEHVTTNAERRKQAYETGFVDGDETDYRVEWNSEKYTTDALTALGVEYEFRREAETADAIKAIVAAGVQVIRTAYPDEAK